MGNKKNQKHERPEKVKSQINKVKSQIKKSGPYLQKQNKLPATGGGKKSLYTNKLQEILVPKRKPRRNGEPSSPPVIHASVANLFFTSNQENVEATKKIDTPRIPKAGESEFGKELDVKMATVSKTGIEKPTGPNENESTKPDESSKVESLPKTDNKESAESKSADMDSGEKAEAKTQTKQKPIEQTNAESTSQLHNVSPDLFSGDNFIDHIVGCAGRRVGATVDCSVQCEIGIVKKCDASANTVISIANIFDHKSGENTFLNRFADRLGVDRQRLKDVAEDLRCEDQVYQDNYSDRSNDDDQNGYDDRYTDEISDRDRYTDEYGREDGYDDEHNGEIDDNELFDNFELDKIPTMSSESSSDAVSVVEGSPPQQLVYYNGRFHQPYNQ